MKHKNILRMFGVAIIFMLLIAVFPAAHVLAARTVTLSPAQAKVGQSVTVTGEEFLRSTLEADPPVERYVSIYFSSDSPPSGTYFINEQITHYTTIFEGVVIDEGDTTNSYTGSFTYPFIVPSTIGSTAVTTGTYYVYVSLEYTQASVPLSTDDILVRAYAPITVTPSSTIELSPASGPAGTSVQITGSNFPASATIVIKFDGTAVAIASGDTVTKSTGILISNITVPAGTATGSHSISVTAGTSTTTANFAVTASATLDPISPTSGPPGTEVNISGANFPANTALVFKLDTTTLTPKAGTDAATRSSGVFISIITIPTGTAAGAHTITVTAGTGTATAAFTSTAPATTTTTPPPTSTTSTPPPTQTTTTPKPSATTLTLNKSGDFVGSSIGIGGSGFKKNGTITLKYDDKTVGTATADASGFFVATFAVPASKHGSHTITATDGTNTNTTTFALESVPPKTPQPLSPGMGATVKSPPSFDWEDVTDNSTPVTYKLQIATSSNFAANTIVIDKSDLPKSEYTLTETEALRLSSDENQYYWREKAVDGAQNESDWTGAGLFSVSQPFKFTGWPMILVIIVGAVVMWLFGFWIGRKTAFYY